MGMRVMLTPMKFNFNDIYDFKLMVRAWIGFKEGIVVRIMMTTIMRILMKLMMRINDIGWELHRTFVNHNTFFSYGKDSTGNSVLMIAQTMVINQELSRRYPEAFRL